MMVIVLVRLGIPEEDLHQRVALAFDQVPGAQSPGLGRRGPGRDEGNALFAAEPGEGLVRFIDVGPDQGSVALPVVGFLHLDAEDLILGVDDELLPLHFGFGAEDPLGRIGSAAWEGILLQEHHLGAPLGCGQGCAKPRTAGTDHDDVGLGIKSRSGEAPDTDRRKSDQTSH